MKSIIMSLAAILATASMFTSCKKDEFKVFNTGGNAPALTASTTAARLVVGEDALETIRFAWTNPEYRFTTGISSHDVSYTLELDTLGANFRSSKKYPTTISKDLVKAYTQSELNSVLGNVMQLTFGRTYTIEARIISSLVNNSLPLNSNVVKFTATPFAPPPLVEPPTAGTLWITGNAVGSNWSNPLAAPYDVSQRFTRVSNTLYELTVPMIPGGAYKLIQTQGNWDTQYKFLVGTGLAGTFEKRNADPAFPAPAVAGTYKLVFNFQSGTFTATKQ